LVLCLARKESPMRLLWTFIALACGVALGIAGTLAILKPVSGQGGKTSNSFSGSGWYRIHVPEEYRARGKDIPMVLGVRNDPGEAANLAGIQTSLRHLHDTRYELRIEDAENIQRFR